MWGAVPVFGLLVFVSFSILLDPGGFLGPLGVGVWPAGARFRTCSYQVLRRLTLELEVPARNVLVHTHPPLSRRPSASGTPRPRLIGATQTFHYHITGRPSKPPWPPSVVVPDRQPHQTPPGGDHRWGRRLVGQALKGGSWDEAYRDPREWR